MVGGGGGVLEFHRSSYQWKKSIIADIARLQEKKNQTKTKIRREREESNRYTKHRRLTIETAAARAVNEPNRIEILRIRVEFF